jgi:hypothetical protein
MVKLPPVLVKMFAAGIRRKAAEGAAVLTPGGSGYFRPLLVVLRVAF